MTNVLDISEKRRTVQVITYLIALSGLLVPKSFVEQALPLIGFSLILLGVPHGAGDYLLSRELSAMSGKVFSPLKYLSGYLIAMVFYLLLWVFEPVLAFGAFIFLSSYHFGQSNWANVHFPSKMAESVIMLCWGLGVVGVPVLLHFEQAGVIISEMTVGAFQLSSELCAVLIFLLIFINIGIIIQLYQSQIIAAPKFKQELGKLILLLMLFFTTPLLVGFGVYFVLWHSFDSMHHQVALLQASRTGYRMRDYFLQSLPLTLVSFAGLGLLLYFFGDTFNKGQSMGALFLFIAVITVPHTILMEWLYRVQKPLILLPFSLDKTEKIPE
jgi:beta-carotene 15,15'-dioxygenase